jgi:hypothetical protein
MFSRTWCVQFIFVTWVLPLKTDRGNMCHSKCVEICHADSEDGSGALATREPVRMRTA